MAEKALYAEIVKSGIWLYDNQVPHEVWIVRQNFASYYEEGYEDGPEVLNSEGELFNLVFAHNGSVRSVGPAKMSLSEAITEASERLAQHQLTWDDHRLQRLFQGRYYSLSDSRE